jgi:type I restriction enzyme S subunit
MKGALVETPISDEWMETTLGTLAHWRGGMTPSMANPDYWVAGDIPWISSKEVTGMELVSTDKKVTATALKETSLRLIEAGSTVIVVRSGILLHTLTAAYVPYDTTVNKDIKIGSPIDGTDGLFLTFLIRANAAEILNRYRKTGTTVQSINVPALMGHQVLVPPLPVQKRIASLLTHFINQGNVLDQELDAMKILRTGLLSSLLEQSLTIDEAYENILAEVA